MAFDDRSQGAALEKACKAFEPGDFFFLGSSGELNQTISDLAGVPGGHMVMSVGNGNALEIPVRLGTARQVLGDPKLTRLIGVRAMNLTKTQRQKILEGARAIVKRVPAGRGGYSESSLAVSGIRAAVSYPGRAVKEAVAETFGRNSLPARYQSGLLDVYRYSWGLVASLMSEPNKYMCASLIATLHADAGAPIVDAGFLRNPRTIGTDEIWTAVQRFPCYRIAFDYRF